MGQLLSVLESISRGEIPDFVKNAMLLTAIGAEGFRLSMSDTILVANMLCIAKLHKKGQTEN